MFGLVAAAVVISLVALGRHELLRFAIERGASLASGYTISVGDQRIGLDGSALFDVHVSHAGQPLLDAKRIDVRYSLRDLFPGSTRRFGLAGIDISSAKLTIVKFKDGTYNFIIPGPAPPGIGAPEPGRVNDVPIRFTLQMHDAGLELREPQAYDTSAKDVIIHHFNVDASVDSAKVTAYHASGAFAARRDMPFTIVGKIDAVRSYAMHHAQAPRFPLRALANYFADTPIVRVLRGGARNFDARLYSLDVRPNQDTSYHANLQLDIDDGRIAMSALAAPLDHLHGHLQLVDNACFLKSIDGTLTGIPLHITGGIFDLLGDLTGSAQLRLGVYGTGDINSLRKAFTFTRDQPVSGSVDLGVLVQGPIDNPMIIAQGHSRQVHYRDLAFDGLHAGVIYRDSLVALAPLHANYAGADVSIHGSMVIADKLHSELSVHVNASTDRLPYLDDMLGKEPMLVDAAVTGNDLTFRVVGSAASARGTQRVAAILELDPNGTAEISPFWLHTERGSVEGGYYLDRPNSDSRFWAVLSNLRMHTPSYKTFPGITLPEIPKIDSRSFSATVAGGGSGDRVYLAGIANAGTSKISGVDFESFDASFAGTLAGAAVNSVHARGPWGTFHGAGEFSTQTFIARGAYAGTFEGLQPFLGDAIPGHGELSGTAAIAVEQNRIVVEGTDMAMHNATLRGVPIDRASITLAVDGDRLHVYSAHAHAAGGDIVAAGTYALTPGTQRTGALSLVVQNLDAAQLKGIGLPLDAGRLWATGDLRAGAPIPGFDGGVSVAKGHMQQFALSGAGDVHLEGDSAKLNQMIGAIGTTYAHVSGTIGSLSSGSPAYGLDAVVPAGNVAGALHSLGFSNYMTQGSFNARLRMSGRGVAPTVAGNVAVPAGDVNGLPFVDGRAGLAADTLGVAVNDGSVLVGTTRTTFGAAMRPHTADLHVVAPHARLEDFNNFFDTGDTLAGNGSVRFAVAADGPRIASSGNVDIAGFRYRNLPIGDTRGEWSSAHDVITGSVAVGGKEGLLRAHGSIGVAPRADLYSTILGSHYDLAATVSDLDLSLWVPAAGFPGLPVSGRVSGTGSLRGRYPDVALRANADLFGGTLGPLAIDTATVGVHSSGSRIAIDRALLRAAGIEADATGSFGLRQPMPLDVQVHAATNDLPRLVYQLARVKVPVSGAFESTLNVGGTYKAPTFRAGIDATGVVAYGIGIQSMFGEVRLHGNTVQLSNAGATFAKGEATLAGSMPLQLSPLRIGPGNAPVSMDLDVVDLDPAVFAGVFGHNTKITGTINGHLGISGTIGTPIVLGHASLVNGSYSSDLERTAITQAAMSMTFDRTTATITKLFGKFGNGTIAGTGKLEFPGGFTSLNGYSFDANAVAKGAQFDFPAYGNGTLDADVTLAKKLGARALFSGQMTLSNATLPFSAFVNAATQAGTPGGPGLPPIAFDLKAVAGKNVRVRGNGYGAGLDLGATGAVRLGGTLDAPTLDGSFKSTGGTLTYFDRAFRVQEGSVSFTPADGLQPTIHAVASTNVVNPDPDRVRNPYGSADITISVNGQIAGLNIDFSTNPPGYSRDQIIGMIAPFGGFISGIAFTNESVYQVQSPGGFTPLGALQPVPGGIYRQSNGTISVGQEAFSILNAQFAAGLLGPVETALGQGLGLSSVNLTLGYYGNVGVSATRVLGKNVSAVYATTFGLPQVQSFGVKFSPSAYTSANLNFFYQTGPQRIYQAPGSSGLGYNGGELLGEPLLGQSGFSFSLKRYL